MGYTVVSVPKSGQNPGRPMAKDPNIVLFRWKDVLTNPARDDKGVKITSNLVLKSGAYAMAIYATPTTIKSYDTSSGDPDKKGYIQNLEFEHPGNELEYEEWAENNVNENLGAFVTELDTSEVHLLGTKGSPLQFNHEGQNDAEAITNMVKLVSLLPGPKMARYEGDIPTLDTEASGA